MISLSINGKPHNFDAELSIDELLDHIEVRREGLAVAVNGSVIPKSNHSNYQLRDKDELEIIHAVGGG